MRLDSLFWRRLARLGAARGPEWWVRHSPRVFGWAAAALVPSARSAVLANLERVRGRGSVLEDARDVALTFSNYALSLSEILASGSKNDRDPELLVYGDSRVADAIAHKKGIVFVTAHTAGWEIVGRLLGREHHVPITLAMEPERDAAARRLQDGARLATGQRIVHVGEPLASLTLLQRLRAGEAIALQIDRCPPQMRARSVEMFGARGVVPEGPLRLAQASGAPILPAFSARRGYRSYLLDIGGPIVVPRRATEAELGAAAQAVADAFVRFVRAHPTDWFHFSR